jgi:hypothetical protein
MGLGGGVQAHPSHEHQIQIHKQTEMQLEKQLVRAKAEIDATQHVVDVLVGQGGALRLERESTRIVTHAVISAASQMSEEHQQNILHAIAEGLAWRSIALALASLQIDEHDEQGLQGAY